MKIDSLGYQESVAQAAEQAIRAERDGYDTWWATETKADPFLECLIAAEQTERIGIRTGIAVAFARNPMTVAVQANDVHAYSQGRFELGLGAQVKAHITRRYAMPYDHPLFAYVDDADVRPRTESPRHPPDLRCRGRPGFIAVYEDEAQRVQRIAKLKAQIGFYASTPTYRRVLTLHGWEAEGEELTAMSKRGEWGRLADLITDEMLDVLAITGTPDEVAPEIERRYGDIATRIVLPGADEPEASLQVRDALRAAGVL